MALEVDRLLDFSDPARRERRLHSVAQMTGGDKRRDFVFDELALLYRAKGDDTSAARHVERRRAFDAQAGKT